MKKFLNKLIPILLTALAAGFFISCQEDPLGTPDINNSLPEVTAINASAARIIAGNSVDVSVTAAGTNTYAWSASKGSFADASSASTTWSSEGIEETENVKLICTVTNSSGPINASVPVTAVVPADPFAHWTFDTDKKDAMGGLDAVGDDVTINTSEAKIGDGCASFPGAGEEFDPAVALTVPNGDSLLLGPNDDYTVITWLKTEELGGIIYGRTFDGFWDWDAGDNCKMWGFWENYGDPALALVVLPWTTLWPEYVEITDGEWHHMVAVHYGEDDSYLFYVDGEVIGEGNLEYDGSTSEDGETVFTIGGSDYPGSLNGLMDDFRYYNEIIGESEIALLADQ